MDAEVPDPARYEQLFARLPERFRKYDTAEFHVVTAVNGNQSPSRWMRVNDLRPPFIRWGRLDLRVGPNVHSEVAPGPRPPSIT